MKRIVQTSAALALVALALGLVACGGDHGAEPESHPTQPVRTEASTPPPSRDRGQAREAHSVNRRDHASSEGGTSPKGSDRRRADAAEPAANRHPDRSSARCDGKLDPADCAAATELAHGDKGDVAHPAGCSAGTNAGRCAELGQVEQSDASPAAAPKTGESCPPDWPENDCRLAEELAQRGSG